MTEQALGTTTVTQVGIIVADIETKAKAWADVLGLSVPEIIITDAMDKAQTEYQGAPTPARAKLAFFHLGQVDLELIEPIDGPSTWKDQLDQHGDSLHHIAFVGKRRSPIWMGKAPLWSSAANTPADDMPTWMALHSWAQCWSY